MGANNSTPQTVRMENPQRGLAVEVTPSVVSRLEGFENQVKCTKYIENQQQEQEKLQHWSETQDIFLSKYHELEEYQFDKSFEKVESMIGKPLEWVEDVNETITMLRLDLIKCYQDHPKQSLCCADVAKKYQDFIFREQYKTILKSNEQHIAAGLLKQHT